MLAALATEIVDDAPQQNAIALARNDCRMRTPKDASERKAIEDVAKHGWHVLKVMEDGKGPGFAYTMGLHYSFGHPELILVGLPLDVAHSVLNVAGEAIRLGEQYSEGVESAAFLEDRLCTFRNVPERQYRNYLGWNVWFYDGETFSALQLVWADEDGRWPWDAAVDPWVRDNQPVIEDQGDPPWAPSRAG